MPRHECGFLMPYGLDVSLGHDVDILSALAVYDWSLREVSGGF